MDSLKNRENAGGFIPYIVDAKPTIENSIQAIKTMTEDTLSLTEMLIKKGGFYNAPKGYSDFGKGIQLEELESIEKGVMSKNNIDYLIIKGFNKLKGKKKEKIVIFSFNLEQLLSKDVTLSFLIKSKHFKFPGYLYQEQDDIIKKYLNNNGLETSIKYLLEPSTVIKIKEPLSQD